MFDDADPEEDTDLAELLEDATPSATTLNNHNECVVNFFDNDSIMNENIVNLNDDGEVEVK